MAHISWDDFTKVELRAGTIIEVNDFPEARKPAYQVKVDFGEDVGIKKSSAQITDLYTKDDLMNKQIVAVINFPPKQIGSFMSECLITGFYNSDNNVVLAVPDQSISNGVLLV